MSKYLAIALAVIILGAALVFLGGRAPGATPPPVLELKNGDTYELVMDEVTKTIGGRAHTMLAYNGSIPGPLLKVPPGALITVNFRNASDIPTMLHSHGVRMDNASDGSQTTQKEIPPGGTFAYTLKFPDAGMYWYHPHVKDYYAQERGAYGGYLVTPSDAGYWPPVNREEVWFLDDILIERGEIAVSAEAADRTLMGRFGNTMLVNGEEDFVLKAMEGEVVRLYLVNAANTRTFNVAIPGATMRLVGGDSGAYEQSVLVGSVLLGPSERAVVDVQFARDTVVVNRTPKGETTLASVAVAEEAAVSYMIPPEPLTFPETVRSIDPFRRYFAKALDKRIALTSGGMTGGHGSHMMPGTMMGGMMGSLPEGGIEWEDVPAMNQMSSTGMVQWNMVDMDAGAKNMDIDWIFKKGEPVKIRIENPPNQMHPMQHPIHFHGQRFLVISRDGVEQTNLVWKDTVLVKAGETVDIVLDPSNPGAWMAHCHILEHIEAGMMTAFTVE